MFFFVLVSAASAQIDVSACGALKLLPKDAAKRLVRIEARGGTPAPDRWYLLVYDPDAPRGLREFVVVNGKIAANRTLSQFADGFKLADVVGADLVKIDSDQASRLAAAFAAETGKQVGSLDYQVERNPREPGAVWRVTVLDPVGDRCAVLVVMADSGRIISHDGFDREPTIERMNAALALGRPASSGQRPAAVRSGAAPRPASVSGANPVAKPKPTLLRRIFGAKEGKPPGESR